MRAARYHGIGDVRIEEVPEPPAPKADEVLIRVRMAGICGTDAAEYVHGPRFLPSGPPHPHSGFGLPMILGHEFTGEVVAVGEGVRHLRVGERVVSGAGVSCGTCEDCRRGRTNLCRRYFTLGLHAPGGLADYVLSPAAICLPVPPTCTDDRAAMAQPLAVAAHAFHRSGAQPGQEVLVLGAGAVGSLLILVAAENGCVVTAVDRDPEALERARRLGARRLVAGEGGDLTAALGRQAFSVVFETSGSPALLAEALRQVRRGGTIQVVGLQMAPPTFDFHDLVSREVDIRTSLAHVFAEDMPMAVRILDRRPDLGEILVDRVIALEDLVAEGLRPLAEGRCHGKVLIAVGG